MKKIDTRYSHHGLVAWLSGVKVWPCQDGWLALTSKNRTLDSTNINDNRKIVPQEIHTSICLMGERTPSLTKGGSYFFENEKSNLDLCMFWYFKASFVFSISPPNASLFGKYGLYLPFTTKWRLSSIYKKIGSSSIYTKIEVVFHLPNN